MDWHISTDSLLIAFTYMNDGMLGLQEDSGRPCGLLGDIGKSNMVACQRDFGKLTTSRATYWIPIQYCSSGLRGKLFVQVRVLYQ